MMTAFIISFFITFSISAKDLSTEVIDHCFEDWCDAPKVMGFMKGHTDPNNQLVVFKQGKGRFYSSAINTALNEDLFPVKDLLGNQVEQIRFHCSEHESTLWGPIVTFPSKYEIANRGITIDIPCKLNSIDTKKALKQTFNLLKLISADPNTAVTNTNQVLAACDKDPIGKACKYWTTLIGKIFSGEIEYHLRGGFRACGVAFKVGYGPLPPNPAIPSYCYGTFGLEYKPNATRDDTQYHNKMWADSYKIAETKMPNCKSGDFTKCLKEISEFQSYLSKCDVRFLDSGRILVYDQPLPSQSFSDLKLPLQLIMRGFYYAASNAVANEAKQRLKESPQRVLSASTSASREQWARAMVTSDFTEPRCVHVAHMGSSVGIGYSGVASYKYIGDGCGTDIDCHTLSQIIEMKYDDRANLKTIEEGKYYLVEPIFLPNGELDFRVGPGHSDYTRCRSGKTF